MLNFEIPSNPDQQDILNLFNRLVVNRAPLTGRQALKALLSAEQKSIDDEYELDNKVRTTLEERLLAIPDSSLDASALLTEGPFKGKSILWVAAYIGASSYICYAEDDTLIEGYRYILGKVIDKASPETLQFNSAFTHKNYTISTLWLILYAHLKSFNNDEIWILDHLLDNVSEEDFLKLNFNELFIDQDRVALSPLALVIKSDNFITADKKRKHLDQTKKLLNKVSPRRHPDFFNFNALVLDSEHLGMTTLCLAAKADAEYLHKTKISNNSPFISILRKSDLGKLDFKAKIRKGPHKGKSAFWYAASMLEQDESCYSLIEENADFIQLDFNDKAEDPADKDANKSALWFVSYDYAEHDNSKYPENVFQRVKNLTSLDYNNAPTNPNDPHLGKTILWNLGKAALSGKPKPFTTALKQGVFYDHNYAARACNGEHADKSVLGFALALAIKGNFKPLNLILRNIKNFKLNPDAIGPYELEMLCHLAKNNYLYPLEVLLPTVKITPQLLNRVSTIDNSGKSICFFLIELAWAGYPQFLRMALKDINCADLMWDQRLKTELNANVMKEVHLLIRDVSRYEMPFFNEFVHSRQDTLTEQLEKLNLEGSSTADLTDYQHLSEPFKVLTEKFDQLKISSRNHSAAQRKKGTNRKVINKIK